MTPIFGQLSATGAHLLRRWVDAGMHSTDPGIVPDDVRALHRLLVEVDSSRTKATAPDTGNDAAVPVVDDAPMTQIKAADQLGCDPRTIKRMIDAGQLPTVMVGRRPRVVAGAIARLKRGGQHE